MRASPATLALPFDIRFNLEMTEQQSARNLRFSDAVILVKGNTEAIETDQVILNPDQVTFDPLFNQRRRAAPGTPHG